MTSSTEYELRTVLTSSCLQLRRATNLLTSCTDGIRKPFAQALTTFIPFLSQTSIQIANRLEIYQKEHDFHDKSVTGANGETNQNAGLEVAALQLEAVIDLPQINTRAGLFIFLNSLVSSPLQPQRVI